MRSLLRSTLLAALPLLCACSALFANGPDPIVAGKLPDPPVEHEPPRSIAYSGEIRDFATFRLEPGAVLEFWSDLPGYAPTAAFDGHGGFSIRVDACQRRATVGEGLASALILPYPMQCAAWIGRFGLRARLGAKCSLSADDELAVAPGRPLVLWLRECESLSRGEHPWGPTI